MHPAAKPVVFALCLLPLAWLVFGAATDRLGPNPAEALIRSSGDWALRALCLALAVTPLRVITGTPALARFRRMLGLFVYFYAVLHLMAYAWLDMGFDWPEIVYDIGKRPFILVGTLAIVLLTLLAATSFNRAIRWLGAKRWQALHRIVYAVAGLALLHFSGCARARTTSPRWRCTRPSSARCWAGACGSATPGARWPPARHDAIKLIAIRHSIDCAGGLFG